MRLCEIYKNSSERYYNYGKQLAKIQATNKHLLVELTHVFESHFTLPDTKNQHLELKNFQS